MVGFLTGSCEADFDGELTVIFAPATHLGHFAPGLLAGICGILGAEFNGVALFVVDDCDVVAACGWCVHGFGLVRFVRVSVG